MIADLASALRKRLGPPLRALAILESLEGRAQNLVLPGKVVAPELHVLEQPSHVDVEALRTNEDWGGDVVGVSSHLRAVEPTLGDVEPLVEAQEDGSQEDLDGVQERGVADTPARLPVVATNDLEDVGLVDQVENVLDVLGLVVDVAVAVLVTESICIVLVKDT